MTKKTSQQRKKDKQDLDTMKLKRKLVKEDIEVVKKMNEVKFNNYRPGPAFETRMEWQEKDDYWELCKRHDEIKAEFELMQLYEQERYYEQEVARLLGEVAARD